jgi:hypothetical protein
MRFFRDLAEREAPMLKSEGELLSLARLDAELDNLRGAIEGSRSSGDEESELRIIAALWFYWNVRGETKEGLDWLEGAPLDDENIHPDIRAEAMVGDGRLRLTEGDASGAARAGRRLEDLAPSCSVPGRYLGWGKFLMGHEAFKEPDRVRSLAAECLQLMTQFGDPWERALAITLVGEVERAYGSPVAAAAAYESAIQLLLHHGGEQLLIAMNQHNLGQTSLVLGNVGMAESNFRESCAAGRELGASKLIFYAMMGLAGVAQARGRPVHAARLLGAADAAFARIGYEIQPVDRDQRDGLEKELRSELGDKNFEESHALGRRLEPQEALSAYEALEGADMGDLGVQRRRSATQG